MTSRTLRRRLPLLVVLLIAGIAIGVLVSRSHTSVTRARLERSLPPTFARLYVQQAALLGHKGITVQSLHARAQCDKGGPNVSDEGPGNNWICLMTWKDPNLDETLLPGKFELNVHSNDCYTAGGPSKIVGLAAITDTHGNDVMNPVFEFDGCFNPRGTDRPTGVTFPTTTSTTTATVAALTLPTGVARIDRSGVVSILLACSAGAGGCAGTIAPSIGSRDLERQTFAIAAGKSARLALAIPRAAARGGTKLTLTVTPVIGTTSARRTTLALAPA